MTGLALATDGAAATRILSLAEVKTHLRVTSDDEDTLIGSLIDAFESHIDGRDGVLGRALITQTWQWTLDDFPASDEDALLVPLPPCQSVTSIQYVDTDGDTQTWNASNWVLDNDRDQALIYPDYNVSWPSLRDQRKAVTITFTAGYGDSASDVPEAIRQAGLLTIGHWYENRQQVAMNANFSELPFAVQSLLAPLRVLRF